MRLLSLGWAWVWSTLVLYAQSLIWVAPPEQRGEVELLGVSADGSVAVGYWNRGDRSYALRWSETSGTTVIGSLGGPNCRALDVSGDGQVVVGWGNDITGYMTAFRWTPQSGMQNLRHIYLHRSSEARAISADGRLIVGIVLRGEDWVPLCWSASNQVWQLPTTPYRSFFANDVSADGAVIVGYGKTMEGYNRAVYHTADGLTDLGTLGSLEAEANAVSPDGQFVVGYSGNARGQERAFRWHNGVMQDLGVANGFWGSRAHGVSADGNCVVGVLWRDGSMWAGIWTPELGTMTDMNQLYAGLLTDGSQLVVARAISSDGTTIVGLGRRPSGAMHGFVLRRTSGCQLEGDVDRNGSVDDADLLEVLFQFGQDAASPADLNRDGSVDDADLLIVLFNFGAHC